MKARSVPNVRVQYQGGEYKTLVQRKPGTPINPRLIPHIWKMPGYWLCVFHHKEKCVVIVGRGETVTESYNDWWSRYVEVIKPRNPSWTITP